MHSPLLRPLRACCLVLMASLGLASQARAEESAAAFPSKPIRLVMGQSPGGAPDILARILGDHVGKTLGQPVVVDFKPSGGGVIAQDTVARAPADGYTWLLATPTMVAVAPYIKRKLPFDPFKDFLPLTQIGETANVLVVGPGLNVKTSGELVQYAKKHPGKLQYASAGLGSTAHLAGALFATSTQTDIHHIPYKGAGQALNDVVAGQVHFMITSPAAAKTFMESGRLKALATTGSRPDPILPDLPLLNATVPGYELVQWWGIVLRAGTPQPIADKIHAAFAAALQDPKVREQFRIQGVNPRLSTMREFDAFIQSERLRYQELIKRANVPQED